MPDGLAEEAALLGTSEAEAVPIREKDIAKKAKTAIIVLDIFTKPPRREKIQMILGYFIAIVDAMMGFVIKILVLIILILFIQVAWPKYKELRDKQREKEWWKPKGQK